MMTVSVSHDENEIFFHLQTSSTTIFLMVGWIFPCMIDATHELEIWISNGSGKCTTYPKFEFWKAQIEQIILLKKKWEKWKKPVFNLD